MGNARSYIRAAAAIARVVAVDIAGDVAKCKIAKLHAGIVGSVGCAGASLVDVCLLEISFDERPCGFLSF